LPRRSLDLRRAQSIVCHPTEFRPLTRSPYTPTTIDDFLYSDRPLLSLRIVSFEDATLVLLSWPHVFVDALGITALFKNWIAVLEGREEDVQPLQGYDTDPLATMGTKPTESSVIAGDYYRASHSSSSWCGIYLTCSGILMKRLVRFVF
jgi:hypothetical protein